jgi:hypothetical protein
MITIPTTELIGGLTDVLPHISDEKGATAGVAIEWDGEALRFTVDDHLSGVTVTWVPGEGAEGSQEEREKEDAEDDDIEWGGEDEPWRVFIWPAQAKEIVKLFKLPAKLWRFPVTLKASSPSRDRLIIEREDGPRVGRLLMVQTDQDVLPKLRDPAAVSAYHTEEPAGSTAFAHTRIGAFGAARFHGAMTISYGGVGNPAVVHMGTRLTGYIYPTGAKPRPFNVLRDGAGVMVGGQAVAGKSVPDLNVF